MHSKNSSRITVMIAMSKPFSICSTKKDMSNSHAIEVKLSMTNTSTISDTT